MGIDFYRYSVHINRCRNLNIQLNIDDNHASFHPVSAHGFRCPAVVSSGLSHELADVASCWDDARIYCSCSLPGIGSERSWNVSFVHETCPRTTPDLYKLVFTRASGSQCVGRIISGVNKLSVCPHSKRNMTWAINTKLGKHIVHGRTSACIDLEVKRSKIEVIWLSNALPMWVCRPKLLFTFLVYSAVESWWCSQFTNVGLFFWCFLHTFSNFESGYQYWQNQLSKRTTGKIKK